MIRDKIDCLDSSCSTFCKSEEKRSAWLHANSENSSQALDLSFNKSFESQHEDRTNQNLNRHSSVASKKIDKNERRTSFSVRNIMSLPERSSPPAGVFTPQLSYLSVASSGSVVTPKATRRPFTKGNSFDSKLDAVKRLDYPVVKEEAYEPNNFCSELGKVFFCR